MLRLNFDLKWYGLGLDGEMRLLCGFALFIYSYRKAATRNVESRTRLLQLYFECETLFYFIQTDSIIISEIIKLSPKNFSMQLWKSNNISLLTHRSVPWSDQHMSPRAFMSRFETWKRSQVFLMPKLWLVFKTLSFCEWIVFHINFLCALNLPVKRYLFH